MTDEEKLAAAMAALDAAAEQWAQRVGWRGELDNLTDASRSLIGPGRLKGPAGAELSMLVLRQRNLIDRWVRQAFIEGLMQGRG